MGVVFRIPVAMPTRPTVVTGAIKGDTMVVTNVDTEHLMYQLQHLWMGDQALQIRVIFGGKTIGFVALYRIERLNVS